MLAFDGATAEDRGHGFAIDVAQLHAIGRSSGWKPARTFCGASYSAAFGISG